MTPRFVVATGWRLWVLDAIACDGLTLPWRAIWMRQQYVGNPVLRAHELIHCEQMDRDGTLTFCVRYIWQLARKGYWNIDYEIEAYAGAPAKASSAAGGILSSDRPLRAQTLPAANLPGTDHDQA